jgi:uncharacterized protein YciI
MFVIELIYKADLRAIDARMTAHVAFLRRHYAAGSFLVSGSPTAGSSSFARASVPATSPSASSAATASDRGRSHTTLTRSACDAVITT